MNKPITLSCVRYVKNNVIASGTRKRIASALHFLHIMDIQPDTTGNRYAISACGEDSVVIDNATFHGSLIVMPDRRPIPWSICSFRDLTIDDLTALTSYRPDLILLGTGQQMQRIPENWIFTLLGHGILIESMTTRAACGTYNLMLSEERRVLLALIREKISSAKTVTLSS